MGAGFTRPKLRKVNYYYGKQTYLRQHDSCRGNQTLQSDDISWISN